ncbi:efflux RND transporter periplasmic adaptor subunit [Methylobacterium sp. PvR107]|uniref:efflux RND transporter periplasmic adaptor subunit n=1 Tax=Methylobacterium sp. PvR107 TaxID=2806597 RepID=UPI001B5FC981|nr:efflux RND transporter periplasmic adaptor subunit [Methylobacterium sp. PvR107]MBP1179766.1 multidrug efflux system membrane fusion protein [Methylobacterium sp. PvR107]
MMGTPASSTEGQAPRSPRHGLWKVTVAVLVLGSVGVAAYRHEGAPRPAPDAGAPAPVPVVTAAVRKQDVPIILTGVGTVNALNVATIRSQVTGYLQSADFEEGRFVRRGDVLARIDPRIYQARLEQAQAQLAKDQALLTNQKTNLARNEPLLQKGFATDQQVVSERAMIAQTESALKGDQAAIDYAQTELDFTTLRAPFDGVTGIRRVDVGNIVNPTDAGGIVVLTQVQPISVLFTLPTSDIAAVQAALGRGPVAATAYDQSGDRKLDTGTLLLINNQADPKSGTVQLKAVFPNSERQLWAGSFVNAAVTTSVEKGALTIPTNALQVSDKGQFVYVVGADDTVAVRPVKVKQRTRGVALVAEGLRDGETVVVQGQYRLKPGTRITPASPDHVPDTSTASAGMLP